VNLVDHDGRDITCTPDQLNCTVIVTEPPELVTYEVATTAQIISMGIGADGSINRLSWDPFAVLAMQARVLSEGMAIKQKLEDLQKLLDSPDLKKDLGTRAQGGDCNKFLTGLIKNLGSSLTAGFSINTLIENIGKATRQADIVANIGANARTTDNTMRIAYNPYDPGYNDWFSTILHEGFHLGMSSASGGNLTHLQMLDAVEAASGIKYRRTQTVDEYIKQMFGDECGKP
jgi:hypothetical protein